MFSNSVFIILSSVMVKTSFEQTTSNASTLGNDNDNSKQLDISEELKNIIFRRTSTIKNLVIQKTDIATASPEQIQEDIPSQDIRNLDFKKFTKGFAASTRYLIYPNIHNYLRVPAYLYNRYKVPDDTDDTTKNVQINPESLPVTNTPITTPDSNISNKRHNMIIPDEEPHPAYGDEERTRLEIKTIGPGATNETKNLNIPYKRSNLQIHDEEPHPAYGDEQQFIHETESKSLDVTTDRNKTESKSNNNIQDKEHHTAFSIEKPQLEKPITNISNNNMEQELLMRTERGKMQWCVDRRNFLMEMMLKNLQAVNALCTPNPYIFNEKVRAGDSEKHVITSKDNTLDEFDKKEQRKFNDVKRFRKHLLRFQENELTQCMQSLNLCRNEKNDFSNPTESERQLHKVNTSEEPEQPDDNNEDESDLLTTPDDESLQDGDPYTTSIVDKNSLQDNTNKKSLRVGPNSEPEDKEEGLNEPTTNDPNNANENSYEKTSYLNVEADKNFDDVYALDYPKHDHELTRKSKTIKEKPVNDHNFTLYEKIFPSALINPNDEYFSDISDDTPQPKISSEEIDNEYRTTVVDYEPDPNSLEESTHQDEYENELEKSEDHNHNIQNSNDGETTDDARLYQTDSNHERLPIDSHEELQLAKDMARRHEQNEYNSCSGYDHSGRKKNSKNNKSINKKASDKKTTHAIVDKEPSPVYIDEEHDKPVARHATHLDGKHSTFHENNSEEEPPPDYPEAEENKPPVTKAVHKKVQSTIPRRDSHITKKAMTFSSHNNTVNNDDSTIDIPQVNLKPKFLKIETVGDLFKYGVIQDNNGLKQTEPKQIFIANDIINKELASPRQLKQIKAFLNRIRRSVNLKVVEEDNDQISFESILDSKVEDVKEEEIKDGELLTNDYKKPVDDVNKGAYGIANNLFHLAKESINNIKRLDKEVETVLMKEQLESLNMDPEPEVNDLS